MGETVVVPFMETLSTRGKWLRKRTVGEGNGKIFKAQEVSRWR
jgi:hypothetical protein